MNAGARRIRAPDADELDALIATLRAEGALSEGEATQLRACLVQQLADSGYIMKNFGVHLTIGAVFAFDAIPLPLGTLGRVGWVVFARVAETLRGNLERARVHSLRVLLVAAIPLLGYVAYLVPLRRDHRELAFLLANHSWFRLTGASYEQFVATRSRFVARIARRLVPLPW